MNHRDPRLKKPMPLAHSGGHEKQSALQSVVVVPNTKSPSDVNNRNIATKTKEEIPSAAFHQQSNKSSKGSPKGKNNSNREPLGKNFKNGKKHSTSPENKLGANAKRHCKPLGKSKRTHSQDSDSQHIKSDHHPIKKHKNEPLKASNKGNSEPHRSEER